MTLGSSSTLRLNQEVLRGVPPLPDLDSIEVVFVQLATSDPVAEQKKDIKRRLLRLNALDAISSSSSVAVVVAAIAAAFSNPLVFSIAAVAGASVVGVAQSFLRHERQILKKEIQELEDAVDDQILKNFTAETNRLTVGGPSS